MFTPTNVAVCSFGAVLVTVVVGKLIQYWDYYVKLSALPTIGHSGFFSSYVSALKFLKHGSQIVEEGSKKYPNQAFKVPLIDRWMVIITGREMMEDVRKSGDDELSSHEAIRQLSRADSMAVRSLQPHIIETIQGPLTRNLATMFSDIYDEISSAFNDEIPLTDDWVKVPTLQKTLNIVCRTTNRLFVGLPLCRNDDWKALNISYTIDFFAANLKVMLFPQILQPLVARYKTPFPRSLKRAMVHLGPIIQDRLERFRAGENDLENDLLTWLIRASPQRGNVRPEELADRVLSINMTAIHTTSQAFTHALINIAAHQEYLSPLRAEVEAAIALDAVQRDGCFGWSKAAMGKMRKLDSFLKESQRVSSSSAASVRRLAMKDFVFSDGTLIPKGIIVSTSPSAIHFDENLYENPYIFDGFRSYNKRSEEGESLKHQMVTPGLDYVAFGTGKHACPGRFFAVNEIKALFSHVLLHYDVKLDEADGLPKTEMFAGSVQSSKTQVMLRRRKDKD